MPNNNNVQNIQPKKKKKTCKKIKIKPLTIHNSFNPFRKNYS